MNKYIMHEPEWKLTKGYKIEPEDGTIVAGSETDICSLHFYHAYKGDKLILSDDKYEFVVAEYLSIRDEKYIYTYDYQKEENWTTYSGNLKTVLFSKEEYVFEHEVYFRVWIRGMENVDKAPEQILKWERLYNEKYDTNDFDVFKKEIEDTIDKVVKINTESEGISFVLMSDSHFTVNGTWKDTINNINSVISGVKEKGSKISGIIHLGDVTDGMVSGQVTADYVKNIKRDLMQSNIPLFYVMGNHDTNYFRKNPEKFSDKEIDDIYLKDLPNNVKRESIKRYYYADYEKEKLRMIFLDSFNPDEQEKYGFDDEQLEWLEDILKRTEKEYATIIFSHVPPVARLHYWSDTIRGSKKLMSILHEYNICSGRKLLGFIHGHNHAEQVDEKEGFPIISIGCAKCEYFTDKKPEGSITYKRKIGDVSQELWDVLSISAKNGQLKFTRFGAGEDRMVEKTKETVRKVITYGTFDLFHEGHYSLLKRAKELGDYLIVGVTTEHYDEQRGKFNVSDSIIDRIENIKKTGLVDEIIIEDREGQKVEDIQKYKIDIFAIGSEWEGVYDYLDKYCKVVYLERTSAVSEVFFDKGKKQIINMGIVGSGRITPRFLTESKYVSGVNVKSVYDPCNKMIKDYAKKYVLKPYTQDYGAFLKDIDAVYVASTHETHYDYIKRAILNGKHVLCEKPLALSKQEAIELYDLAEKRKVVLMEAIKTAYCPGFAKLMNVAKSGKIGEIVDVEACFSRLTSADKREMRDVDYGGAYMEFGSYTLLPIFKLMGMDYEKLDIHSIRAENGVDIYTKILFKYKNGMAVSKTGIGVKSEGQLLISGTKGYIIAESPWWLTKKFQIRYENPNEIETYTPNFVGDGLRYEISDFVLRINGQEGSGFKLTKEESIAMAGIVEEFLNNRESMQKTEWERIKEVNKDSDVRIWAHRGCSYKYPENTLLSFENACKIPGLTGIELDIQLSKDGQIVVFHDETLERVTEGKGNIRDYSYAELKKIRFKKCKEEVRIPLMKEVLEIVKPYSYSNGILINIELKNGKYNYPGLEEKILSLVKEYQMEDYVVYSSFNEESLYKLKKICNTAKTGILKAAPLECLKLKEKYSFDSIHPNIKLMLEEKYSSKFSGMSVRGWGNSEPFYGENKSIKLVDLKKLRGKGITDIFTNIPEEYL